MRIVNFEAHGVAGIAADEGSGWHGLSQSDSGFPGILPELIARGDDLLRIGRALGQSPAVDLKSVRCRRCPRRRKFCASVSTTMIICKRAG